MGDVIIHVKVHLEDAEKQEAVVAKIGETFKVNSAKIEDIGFGIKVLKLVLMAEDSESTPDVESTFSQIEGVSSVEVEGVSRV